MLQRLIFATILLTGTCFSQHSLAIEEASLLVERANRSYDDMLDVRVIRALVVRNKTGYFFDGAQQRDDASGLEDIGLQLVDDLTYRTAPVHEVDDGPVGLRQPNRLGRHRQPFWNEVEVLDLGHDHVPRVQPATRLHEKASRRCRDGPFLCGSPFLELEASFSPERELVERLFAAALAVNRVDHAALVNGHLPLAFPVLDLDDAAPAVRQDQLHGVRERGAFKRYRYR